MTTLEDFMISRVRVKIMELFFSNAEELYYVREITREIKEEINAVRRELDRMLGYGLLKSEQRGNRVYYFLNKNYVFYPELLQMVAKTTGLGKKIRKLRRKLGTVEFVMFSSSYVEKKSIRQDKVDMLVVGEVVLPELQALVKEEEKRLGREINYTVFTGDEFEFRKTRRDPFIMEILYDSRVMIVGNSEDFSARKIQGL